MLKALELDKILLQLANETTCPDAAELAQKIEPDTDIRHVERLLQETDDAFVLMAKYGAPSFYGMTNVTNALRRAEAGGVLNLADGFTMPRYSAEWDAAVQQIEAALTESRADWGRGVGLAGRNLQLNEADDFLCHLA